MTRTTQLTRLAGLSRQPDQPDQPDQPESAPPVSPAPVPGRRQRPAPNNGLPGVTRFSGVHLLRTARLIAGDPALSDRLTARETDATGRRWTELDTSPQLQIWLIGWPPGSSTGWHDHGDARGAFLVTEGALVEQTWTARGTRDRELSSGDGRFFDVRHIHNVVNRGAWPAISVHVYTPRMARMTRYAVEAAGLQVVGVERAGESW